MPEILFYTLLVFGAVLWRYRDLQRRLGNLFCKSCAN
jgi:hypothetical protein